MARAAWCSATSRCPRPTSSARCTAAPKRADRRDNADPWVFEEYLRALHEEDGTFVDRTLSLDADANVLCAQTSSLSQVAVGSAGGQPTPWQDHPLAGGYFYLTLSPDGSRYVSYAAATPFVRAKLIRNCALFSGDAVFKDDPDRLVGKLASASGLADCSATSLGGSGSPRGALVDD